MRKRLLTLTATLALAALAVWVPRAEAVGYCSTSYCAGKSPDASCGCPPGTDKVGKPSFCGGWNTVSASGCWYE